MNQEARKMASWGDINAALNRLVREGVIAGFKTNRGDKSLDSSLHVNVTPAPNDDVDTVRDRILSVLTPLDDEVTVTVGAEEPARA
ncbi:hypothetical protein [uncultured Enterovirga sp.]|uniref:hypothetical protein n=1 Tax=uncultured Enterovirga sp. TaxID=2026352 RepID=UPI0035CA0BBC